MPLEFSDKLSDEPADSAPARRTAPEAHAAPETHAEEPETPADGQSQDSADPASDQSDDTHAAAESGESDSESGAGRLEALKKLTTDATNGEPEGSSEAEPEAAAPETKPEGTPDQPAEGQQPTAISDEDFAKKLKPETASRFNTILKERSEARAKLTEMEPAAKFGAAVADHCQRAGLAPQHFAQWANIGAAYGRGDPAVIGILKDLLKQAEEADTKQFPDAAMPAWLTAKVHDQSMTEEAAKETWSNIQAQERDKRHRAAPKPLPAAQQQPPQGQPAQGQPQTQNQPAANADMDEMNAGIATIQKTGREKHKAQWDVIEAKAYEKVKAMGQSKSPLVILERFKNAIAQVESDASNQQRRAVGAPTLRPSTRSGGMPAKTGRAAALSLLTTGK